MVCCIFYSGQTVPASSLRRIRKELGWVQCRTEFRPQVRIANQDKRVEFCQRMLAAKDRFDDVIFTDESSVQLESHSRIVFKKVCFSSQLINQTFSI